MDSFGTPILHTIHSINGFISYHNGKHELDWKILKKKKKMGQRDLVNCKIYLKWVKAIPRIALATVSMLL